MKVKTKIGMGLKTKKKKKPMKKRILPVAKCSGIIPILPLLRVVGSLVGRPISNGEVTKAISDNKTAQRQLDELKRHRRSWKVMEFTSPYKQSLDKESGQGVSIKKI